MSWYEPEEPISLSDRECRRLEEIAREHAADDPAFAFPGDGVFEDIVLEEIECDDGLAWIARYQGREVEVQLDSDYIESFLCPEPDIHIPDEDYYS